MKKQFFTHLALGSLLSVSAAAFAAQPAEGPMSLSEGQMDKVTAGGGGESSSPTYSANCNLVSCNNVQVSGSNVNLTGQGNASAGVLGISLLSAGYSKNTNVNATGQNTGNYNGGWKF